MYLFPIKSFLSKGIKSNKSVLKHEKKGKDNPAFQFPDVLTLPRVGIFFYMFINRSRH